MHPHRRSQYSHESPFLSLPILIILLPILTLLVLFFTIPPVISFSSQVLRPNAVKKSWDSLNVFLILFAILCGILTRKNDDGSETSNHQIKPDDAVNVPSGDVGFEYSDGKIFHQDSSATVAGYGRLKRNSSSYPDLRQESIWDTGESSLQFRFFDDFEVNKYSSYYNVNSNNVHAQKSANMLEDSDVKEIPVDRLVLHSESPPPAKTPPPPPPPPQADQRKPRRTYHKLKKENDEDEAVLDSMRTPQPPMPPPPPPPPIRRDQMNYQEQKYSKSGRKKINAKEEIKLFVSAIYKQRKKKMQHKVKGDSFQGQSKVNHYMSHMQRTPPPPPPPPPPHSVFHNLFKKGSKSKKVHSYSPPPPPPPPPKIKKKSRKLPAPELPSQLPVRKLSYALPPRPNKVARKFNGRDDNNVNRGKPLIPMPPPPPPPPFKVPEMKFVFRGDYVKVRSAQSSRCSSPELEDNASSSSEIGSALIGGDEGNSVFCPSPDVNVKADTFIARLKDGWRLEKINSLREKHNAGTGLGQ